MISRDENRLEEQRHQTSFHLECRIIIETKKLPDSIQQFYGLSRLFIEKTARPPFRPDRCRSRCTCSPHRHPYRSPLHHTGFP